MCAVYLTYKNNTYKLSSGEIPGVAGFGRITIDDGDIETEGLALFVSAMELSTERGRTYFNGVDLDSLVEKKKPTR